MYLHSAAWLHVVHRHEHKCHVSETACVLPWHSSEVREGERQPLGQQYLHHMTIHRTHGHIWKKWI